MAEWPSGSDDHLSPLLPDAAAAELGYLQTIYTLFIYLDKEKNSSASLSSIALLLVNQEHLPCYTECRKNEARPYHLVFGPQRLVQKFESNIFGFLSLFFWL